MRFLEVELTLCFRRGVSTIIGKGVPPFQLNEINGLKGPHDADGGHFSISIHSVLLLEENNAHSLWDGVRRQRGVGDKLAFSVEQR
jgi:hypothetical protein